MQTIACIENAFESRKFTFDTKSCNGLENAWATGVGDFAALWPACQADERFGDAECNVALAKCF